MIRSFTVLSAYSQYEAPFRRMGSMHFPMLGTDIWTRGTPPVILQHIQQWGEKTYGIILQDDFIL